MELENHSSPILADASPLNKSRLGLRSALLPYPQAGLPFSSKHIKVSRKKPENLDDVRSNGWLDAMKSSSPPRKRLVKEFNAEITSEDTDMAYNSWMVSLASL